MATSVIQTAFNAGELSQNLYARVDLEKYHSGAALLRNFFVDYRGGAAYRTGTKFIVGVKNYTAGPKTVRLIPFVVSTEASYILEFGDQYIRFISNGAQVMSGMSPLEVATPYLAADLFDLKYVQSADVLTIVHPSYAPRNLTRTGAAAFNLSTITVGPTIASPTISNVTATNGGIYFYGYVITALNLNGKEESLPSPPEVDTSEIEDETANKVVRLNWTAPADPVSVYYIYKNGPVDRDSFPLSVFGFIGSSKTNTFIDNNIAPDFSKTPPEFADPFSGGQITSVTVTAPGTGYDGSGGYPNNPFVAMSISGDGSGAAGYAITEKFDGKVVGGWITQPGTGYTSATITANGSGGTGATFSATFSDVAPRYPSAVTYFQQRRAFAAPEAAPETMVFSQIANYNNFDVSPIVLDSDAITVSLASREVNRIESMVPMSTGLVVFTTGGAFLVSGGGPEAPLTPSTITAQAQASTGANKLPPLVINYDILFVQNNGTVVRDLAFNWGVQSFFGVDRSVLADHLFFGFTLEDWTYSAEPFKIVWTVRDDGRLLALTYVPDQEVYAWTRHDTQGAFKSVASVPEGEEDAVYVVVRRHVDFGDSTPCWHDYIERFAPRAQCCIFDAWHLDSALSLARNEIAADVFITGDTETVGATVTLTSNDPCDSSPAPPIFASSTYLMEAKENYDATYAAEFADNVFSNLANLTTQDYVGILYDTVRRKIIYSVAIVSGNSALNETGFTLWSGQDAIAPLDSFDPRYVKNHFIAEKDLDTGTVLFYDCWSASSLVPNGIGGSDGTYRRFVDSHYSTGNSPLLVDPRTGNVWQHADASGDFICTIYLFRRLDNFVQIISPLLPPPGQDGHMDLQAISETWTYVFLENNLTSHYHLLLTPRNITSDETAADYLLTYAEFDFPVLFNGLYFRVAMDLSNNMYLFGAEKTGTRQYVLYQFTEPTSAPYGGPTVGGGFTAITPWAAGTGPNSDSSSYTYNGASTGGDNKNLLMYLPLTNTMACVSKLWAGDTGAGVTNPVLTKFDCTYVDLTGGTFDFHAGFVTGYMTAAWTTTVVAADAAWVVIECRETNLYLNQNSYDFGEDYTKRWFYFTVQPVVAGVWTPNTANNHVIMVEYQFVSGAAPVKTRLYDESHWDDAYTAYAATIGNTNVVQASLNDFIEDLAVGDNGIWDEDTSSWWWSGQTNNMFQLNDVFANRQFQSNISSPFLRITFAGQVTAEGDIIQIGCGKIEVTDVVSTSEITGTVVSPLDLQVPDDPDNLSFPVLEGDWTVVTPTTTVSGLDHLEGKTVYALADGRVEGPLTVSSGSVTLDVAASSIVVGLAYQGQIQTLNLDVGEPTIQGRRKLIPAVTLWLDCTRGLKVGNDFSHLDEIPDLQVPFDAPQTLFTGQARIPIPPDWNREGQICIQQDYPLPATVLGVIPEVVVGDDQN